MHNDPRQARQRQGRQTPQVVNLGRPRLGHQLPSKPALTFVLFLLADSNTAYVLIVVQVDRAMQAVSAGERGLTRCINHAPTAVFDKAVLSPGIPGLLREMRGLDTRCNGSLMGDGWATDAGQRRHQALPSAVVFTTLLKWLVRQTSTWGPGLSLKRWFRGVPVCAKSLETSSSTPPPSSSQSGQVWRRTPGLAFRRFQARWGWH